ncbi:MAG: class I SAM-dependent methyltransferase [Chloroflexi bacterium]|nr:class I SAM-dependent methyltransferase [Chloroflexota bacterium]
MQDDWFNRLDDSLWLKSDGSGRDDAVFIKRALRLERGDRVLDAPCGAGRVALHLAEAGCLVTGIDSNPGFVERAKRAFADSRLPGDFRILDLRDVEFHETFDAVCNCDGSFGYCTDDENLAILRRMAAAIKPGGRLLVEQVNRERILRHFLSESLAGNAVRRNRWDAGSQRLESALYTDAGERPGSFLSVRLYTPSQFKQLLVKAGLIFEMAYGGVDGASYTTASRRFIAVGRKSPI